MANWLLLWACTPKPIIIPPPPPPRTQEAIIDRTPKRTMIMTAWYYTQNRNWEKAEEYFSLAHQSAPEDPWIFLAWGDAAHSVAQAQKAIWAWEQALSRTSTADIDMRTELYQKIDAYR